MTRDGGEMLVDVNRVTDLDAKTFQGRYGVILDAGSSVRAGFKNSNEEAKGLR